MRLIGSSSLEELNRTEGISFFGSTRAAPAAYRGMTRPWDFLHRVSLYFSSNSIRGDAFDI